MKELINEEGGMDYVPHTGDDQKQMLGTIGVKSVEDLFVDIPSALRLKNDLDLPSGLSEQEVSKLMKQLAGKNKIPSISLMGAGAYRHYVPAIVSHIIGRSEFYTAYTPYQPEISQGILQAIFEYQTMIARLTGMAVANASMYDGASAMAEAAVLSCKTLGRKKLITACSVHPEWRKTVQTYAWANGYEVVEICSLANGRVDPSILEVTLDETVAAVMIQSPNFFGVIEDVAAMAPVVHAKGALLIVGVTEATSLGLLKPAGELGADFVVGEGQSFGNALNFGGPYLGILASTEAFMRKIPGRLVGETTDKNGKRGFVLTLQTREQHIRREKATSNICSNEALCMLAAAVYLSSLGKNLKELAKLNVAKAAYLKSELLKLPGWSAVFDGPTYNEFALRVPDARKVNEQLKANGILGGYDLGTVYPEYKNCVVFCATEMLCKVEMDEVVGVLR